MTFETWLLIAALGVLVGGVVGHMRGHMGMGMILGGMFGPLFGPILLMLFTLGGRNPDPRHMLNASERPAQPGPPPS